jgi:hypothetical protein
MAMRRVPLLSGTKMHGARFYPPARHRNVVNKPILAANRTAQKPLIWLEFRRGGGTDLRVGNGTR